MIELIPLCTVAIDLAPSIAIGTGPAGDRSVGEIRGVTVTGERLNATLHGVAAADWLVRTGAIGVIDAPTMPRAPEIESMNGASEACIDMEVRKVSEVGGA